MLAKGHQLLSTTNTIDVNRNSLGFWHCGAHALSLTESYQDFALRVPPIGGVQEWGDGCALEFSIKEGKAAFAKLPREHYKVAIVTGKFVKPSSTMRGGIGEAVIDTDAHGYLNQIMDTKPPGVLVLRSSSRLANRLLFFQRLDVIPSIA